MSGGFDHDMALVVLEESAVETCPSSVPLQINREQITDGMIGEELLQGGFGSLDGTYDFSPIRYWSLIGLVSCDEFLVTCSDHGFTSVDCTLEDCSPNCACLCDTTDECDADCACDEDCPVDAGVDAGSGGGNDDCSVTGGLGAKKGKPSLLALVAWVF